MASVYAGSMVRLSLFRLVVTTISFAAIAFLAPSSQAQDASTLWTFAVSGDSRNCGDFVMPAIAAKVKAENDAFYWHLGDFRWMSQPDQDLLSMLPAGAELAKADYQQMAWDDFLTRQMTAFGSTPVFLGRGNPRKCSADDSRRIYREIIELSPNALRLRHSALPMAHRLRQSDPGITGRKAGLISSHWTMRATRSFRTRN